MSALSCGCDPEEGYCCMNHRIQQAAPSARPLSVIEYVTEEVSRQGHNVLAYDGLLRVSWMLDAWCWALEKAPRVRGIALDDILTIGQMTERFANYKGFRDGLVQVGLRMCPSPNEIEPRLTALLERQGDMDPLSFYKVFEEIHPFFDGNGRAGKIFLNWLSGSLESNPVFPPDTLWGRRIRNP